jgi:hypothetical protein
MASTSKILGERAVIGMENVGEVMMPRDGEFPSFKELGVIVHIDEILEHAPPDDLKALNLLLTLLSFFPMPLLRGFVALIEKGAEWGAPLGGLFRQLQVGLRSIAVTLYFSGKSGRGYTGKTPLDVMDYHVNPVR